MISFLKRLFCNHDYTIIGSSTSVEIETRMVTHTVILQKCSKCKRIRTTRVEGNFRPPIG